MSHDCSEKKCDILITYLNRVIPDFTLNWIGLMENLNAVITGVGGYVPDYVLTNDEMAIVDFCVVKCRIFYFFSYFYMHKGL